MIKIQIKSIFGDVLFEYEKENNTYKDTLVKAVKKGAYLSNADLRGADLRGADLRGAYLRNADLRGAYLSNTDLRGAKEIPCTPIACPSDGAFIGWKKVGEHLVKLEIPEDARRCSATSRKCRCDKAKVLSIWNLTLKKEVPSIVNHAYGHDTEYNVEETVYPDSFDDNRWNECSHGIHFFINKQDAIDY